MNSIAVESEYGSGGSEVGRLVSSKLGLTYHDCQLILIWTIRLMIVEMICWLLESKLLL